MTDHPGDGRDDGMRIEDERPADPPTPAHSGSGGGELARDVGSRDEAQAAPGADPEPTRVTKQDKVQPATASRSDHDGAQRR